MKRVTSKNEYILLVGLENGIYRREDRQKRHFLIGG